MKKNVVDSNSLSAMHAHLAETVERSLDKARALGASQAEVALTSGEGLSTCVRMGEVESVKFNQAKALGITVYFGQHAGTASTSSLDPEAIHKAVGAACDIARETEADPCLGLADPQCLAYNYPNLDLYHPEDLPPEYWISLAKRCESYARDIDKRITNSEGVTTHTDQSHHIYGNTHGFVGHFSETHYSMECALIAEGREGMQVGHEYTVACERNALMSPEALGQAAASQVLNRLDPQKIHTQKLPVIFKAEVASSLLNAFIHAITGSNLYQKSSFLLGSLNQRVFPETIDISETPHLMQGLHSRPFDAEGVATRAKHFVRKGILENYALSSYAGRRLGMQTTGNAGGVFNVAIGTEDLSLASLLKRMDKGILVTELMGHGVQLLTGHYSEGGSGFWVEHGEIQRPIDEFTIAGNLKDMFMHIVGIGNDVDMRKNMRTGSILIQEMMIAGR